MAYSFIRPLLFALDSENAHALALHGLKWLPPSLIAKPTPQPVRLLGMTFAHPIGLAAGFDKNGEYIDALSKLGFSFIEVGTVTPKPQLGNPKPRLFRLRKMHSLINRMGFNNKGVDALVNCLKKTAYQGILGINIGKNKETPLDEAHQDYLYCLRRVYQQASYITINISSPNTPDLRQLQEQKYLVNLLECLSEERKQLTQRYQKHCPILVKISPDESQESLKKMVDIILQYKIEGIIATNTTMKRPAAIQDQAHANEAGGLSGRALFADATKVLRLLKTLVGDDLVLIGVGGIENKPSATEKLEAGANLLQIYTGLIYQGPGLVARLL